VAREMILPAMNGTVGALDRDKSRRGSCRVGSGVGGGGCGE
jgi:hypothetical protein